MIDQNNSDENEPLTNGSNGRDSSGRFTKGWRGGPGNPHARKTAALRKTLVDSITESDMRNLAQSLKALAMGGDLNAMKLLLSYLIGQPTPAVDPDKLDQHEFEILNSRPSQSDLKLLEIMGKIAEDN